MADQKKYEVCIHTKTGRDFTGVVTASEDAMLEVVNMFENITRLETFHLRTNDGFMMYFRGSDIAAAGFKEVDAQ